MNVSPPPLRHDLIVFDWDGTLFDSTALIARCIQAACADLDIDVPSDVDARYVIGMGLSEALQHAAPGLPAARYPELAGRYRYHYFGQQHALTLFDGVVDLLHALRARGHRLAVATGKTRRGLDAVLETVELRGLFAATRTADETASKPHPRMLHELLDELNVTAPRALMVGDTTHDLQMAASAGVPSIGVAYGAHDHRDFAAWRPLHVAHDVADLASWLQSHG